MKLLTQQEFIFEHQNIPISTTDEEFEDALLNLSTLDLEDDQVRFPKFNEKTDHYIGQIDCGVCLKSFQ